MSNQWFSEKQLTKEAAQELHQLKPLEFFSPAFVGRTPEGGFVMGKLRMKISRISLMTKEAMQSSRYASPCLEHRRMTTVAN